jgi:hypothetical protein
MCTSPREQHLHINSCFNPLDCRKNANSRNWREIDVWFVFAIVVSSRMLMLSEESARRTQSCLRPARSSQRLRSFMHSYPLPTQRTQRTQRTHGTRSAYHLQHTKTPTAARCVFSVALLRSSLQGLHLRHGFVDASGLHCLIPFQSYHTQTKPAALRRCL